MEKIKRKPFQGVTNIIRFNWHFYVIAIAIIVSLLFVKNYLSPELNTAMEIILFATIAGIFISMLVSFYVYDCSGLYSLKWLDDLGIQPGNKIININAGFDETSHLLALKYPKAELLAYDFYNPANHTEVSIERARKAYPPFPGTLVIDTKNIPPEANSADFIFLILAAHEIRNDDERIDFFLQLKKKLSEKGKIILLEHFRDGANFIAYNFGAFHFLPLKTWKQTFAKAGLKLFSKNKITPFISFYILEKNGITS